MTVLEAACAGQTPRGPARSADRRPGREHRRPRRRGRRRHRGQGHPGQRIQLAALPGRVRQRHRGRRSRPAQHRADRAPPSGWPRPPKRARPLDVASVSSLCFVTGSRASGRSGRASTGPAGTQMVDSAITAMSEWMASGNTAANGGPFAAAEECQRLMDRTRAAVGQFLGADPDGVSFGPNMTSLTFAVSRAIGADACSPAIGSSGPGSTTTPTSPRGARLPRRRRRTCAGAVRSCDRATAARQRDRPDRRAHQVGHRSRGVEPARLDARPGSDHRGRPRRRRQRLRRRRAPRSASQDRHRCARLRRAGHVAVQVVWPAQRRAVDATGAAGDLPVFKVRPAADHGPAKLETGMPNFEAHRRHRGGGAVPDRGRHGSARRGRGGGVLRISSKACSRSTA